MFDYTLDFKTIDFRQHPELYRVGKGEQGVMLVIARQHKDYVRQKKTHQEKHEAK